MEALDTDGSFLLVVNAWVWCIHETIINSFVNHGTLIKWHGENVATNILFVNYLDSLYRSTEQLKLPEVYSEGSD